MSYYTLSRKYPSSNLQHSKDPSDKRSGTVNSYHQCQHLLTGVDDDDQPQRCVGQRYQESRLKHGREVSTHTPKKPISLSIPHKIFILHMS